MAALLFTAACTGVESPAPATSAPQAAASTTPSPGPAADGHFVEEEVAVGEHDLPGLLTRPTRDDRGVAVVLLWGSGPHDRDSTIGSTGNKMFRDVAHGLAEHGVTTLRFDKRTLAALDSLDVDSFTLDDEYFDDAAAALDLLAEHPDLAGHRLFVVGHSQGGMVLPEVLRRNPEAAGGISLAGSPRSLFDIMYDQQADAIGALEITEEQRAEHLELAAETMEAAKALDDPDGEVPAVLAQSMGAPYLVSLNELDAAATARELDVPLLFLQGEADKQVFHDVDFRAWQEELAGRENVEFRSYPGLSHFFWESRGDSAAADLGYPATVDDTVVEDIAEWLLVRSG